MGGLKNKQENFTTDELHNLDPSLLHIIRRDYRYSRTIKSDQFGVEFESLQKLDGLADSYHVGNCMRCLLRFAIDGQHSLNIISSQLEEDLARVDAELEKIGRKLAGQWACQCM